MPDEAPRQCVRCGRTIRKPTTYPALCRRHKRGFIGGGRVGGRFTVMYKNGKTWKSG